MTPSEAIRIAEEYADTNETSIAAWQLLIDTGLCWQLQGWFGRTAMHLIDVGLCSKPGEVKTTDTEIKVCDACGCTPCDCGWGHY